MTTDPATKAAEQIATAISEWLSLPSHDVRRGLNEGFAEIIRAAYAEAVPADVRQAEEYARESMRVAWNCPDVSLSEVVAFPYVRLIAARDAEIERLRKSNDALVAACEAAVRTLHENELDESEPHDGSRADDCFYCSTVKLLKEALAMAGEKEDAP